MKARTILSAMLALVLAGPAFGQKKLSVGDAAPGLDIEQWVKGSETTIAAGNVYVIEFWATWCAPCKKSIPHLSELQEEFADGGLTIIGISYEEAAKVSPFVRTMGEKMKYTVAVDRRESTKRAWMSAAKVEGIPAAFIVDRNGKVVFIGNPHPEADDDFEGILRQVMAGRYDPKLQEQAEPALKAARQARKIKNWRMAMKHYDEVINLDARIFATIAIERFDMMVRDMGDKDEAYAYAQTLMADKFASDAGALRMLSQKIATDPHIDAANRDMDVALQGAEKALAIAGPNDAEALAGLALVQFKRGDVAKAIDLQKQAYFNANPKTKPGYKRTLTTYQEAAQRTSSAAAKK
jgi:thiol-disulfide isomerase/thioredoxin